ncbi:phosphotransferase [Vallitalea okinawensis]|uniref:phosphotransferase n=1 Tax=Vallitalea okinawensis TaxID=2078660 RepID=UPI000CFDC80B|nr:phosphotransferase [Vallitalea okinawensis]
MEKVINEFLKENEIEMTTVDSYTGKVKKIVTATNKVYFIKEKKSYENMLRETKLLYFLQKNHIPVAVPVKGSRGECYITWNNKTYCIYPKIQGDEPEDFYSRENFDYSSIIGKAIAEYHNVLASYPYEGEYEKINILDKLLIWAMPIIEECHLVDLESFKQLKRSWFKDLENDLLNLPQQIIHRDLHLGNLLFEEGQLTGIIDYDLMAIGPRIYDPCYCCIGFLNDSFYSIYRQEWLNMLIQLFKAYNKSIFLTAFELKAIPYLISLIQLILLAHHIEDGNREDVMINLQAFRWVADHYSEMERGLKFIIDDLIL